MKITTNNVPREIVTLLDVPEKARADFDYMSEDEASDARMVCYRGAWYDLQEFVRIVPRADAVGFAHGADADSPLLKWDGIQTDSYFSGIVCRYSRDGYMVTMGHYYC